MRTKPNRAIIALDGIMRQAVLLRDRFRCVRCGSNQNLEMAHIRSKGTWPQLRHEMENGLTLCARCHRTDPDSAHNHPKLFLAWIKNQWPGRLDLLEDLAKLRSREDAKTTKARLETERDKLL